MKIPQHFRLKSPLAAILLLVQPSLSSFSFNFENFQSEKKRNPLWVSFVAHRVNLAAHPCVYALLKVATCLQLRQLSWFVVHSLLLQRPFGYDLLATQGMGTYQQCPNLSSQDLSAPRSLVWLPWDRNAPLWKMVSENRLEELSSSWLQELFPMDCRFFIH